ncbi:MAG: AhpC/TSA family protein [Rikenellaceae bacterium]|nr:AhpC/TSA family protein [Rikenellaceae bacterium]
MKLSPFVACAALILGGCNSENNVKLTGSLVGLKNHNVVLEQVTTAGSLFVDSVRTDKNGAFAFKFKTQKNEPEFYNLVANSQHVPLIISPGENIEFRAGGNISKDYEIKGSPDSERIKELNTIIAKAIDRIDSMKVIFNATEDFEEKKNLTTEFIKTSVKLKQNYITFIVENSNSMAALYALYQVMPDGDVMFNQNSDLVYYRLVADSLNVKYPDAPHVKRLINDVKKMEANINLQSMLSYGNLNESNYPDLNLPDMFGNNIRLSSVNNGKVVLLDFWVTVDPNAKMKNFEIKKVYEKYHDKGFEVYQIALDLNKSAWVTAVQDSKLPWISVCDFKGANSPAARLYNVQKVPANYLINAKGEIIGKNLTDAELNKKLAELFK